MTGAPPYELVTTRNGPGLWLTFDDGPSPTATELILDILRAHEVTATFFVIGLRVSEYPEIAARIAAEGHELGVLLLTGQALPR